jgi:hypothetical protein
MAVSEIREAVRVGIVLVGLNLIMLVILLGVLKWWGTRGA